MQEWKRRFDLLAEGGQDWEEDNAALDAVEQGESPRRWTSSAGTTMMGQASGERPSVKRNTLFGSEQGPEGLVRKVNTLVNPNQGKRAEVTSTDLDDALLESLDLDAIDMTEDSMMFETAATSSA